MKTFLAIALTFVLSGFCGYGWGKYRADRWYAQYWVPAWREQTICGTTFSIGKPSDFHQNPPLDALSQEIEKTSKMVDLVARRMELQNRIFSIAHDCDKAEPEIHKAAHCAVRIQEAEKAVDQQEKERLALKMK